jgi:hypothetical protein
MARQSGGKRPIENALRIGTNAPKLGAYYA